MSLLLLSDDKKKGAKVVVLMVVNAFLDFFSLASFLPLIFILINPEFVFSNHSLNTLYNFFGFSSPTWFILSFTASLLTFIILKNGIALWITRFKANYCFTLGSDLSSRMLERYFEIGFLKFAQTDFTKELNRMANLPIAFANNIIMPLANLLSEGIVFLLLLACVIIYDIKVFILLSAMIIPIRLVYNLKRRNISNTSDDLKREYPLSLKYALQAIEGLVDIKAFGKEFFFKKRFDSASQALAKTFTKDYVNQTAPSRLTEIIAAFIICGIIAYSIVTNQHSQQTFLLLGIYAAASFRMIPSINRILNALMQIRTHEYLFKELEELTNFQPVKKQIINSSLDFGKTIEFRNISFEYPEGVSVLNDVSLRIEKGRKIALVGKSGSGKTTFLLVLLGFVAPKFGKIILDGVEVRGDHFPEWKKLFGYVSQNPYIVDGSIVDNIAFGLPEIEISSEKINRLIKDLDLEEMIRQLPDGLSTRIGEKGIKLSGGQRQRIAIARALYADAEILLFDEVTNQLDSQTEQEIIQTLTKVAHQKKTILMITHHDHLLNEFDRVLALENGKIVEVPLARTSNS